MEEKIKSSGNCLCGKVTIQAEIVEKSFAACHCGICRKWGGSALLAVHAGPNTIFEGKENIATYDSSNWAERGFCKNCGTHLFYRLKEGKNYYLPIGLLKDTDDLVFTSQIFIDKKPANYEFANKTHNLTEGEFFAKHAS